MKLEKSELVKLIFSIIVISVFAQLTIDVGDIPITGQTLAVLVLATFLRPILIGYTLTFYYVLGGVGLPIFADFNSGVEVLIGNSGGYLIGFVIGGIVVSILAKKIAKINFIYTLLLMTLGTFIILVFGISRLSYSFGLQKALEYGLFPFWKGAIIKIIIGAIIVWVLKNKHDLGLGTK
ncbi:MAG: biotin transporter BioY [Saprospiraceae bacterium]